MPTKRLLIKGKVQGVFYRATARDKAEEYGLKGWVRNTAEGHVEAVVTGTADNIEAFVAWCHQGPSRALVTGVEVEEKPEMEFSAFTILRK